jgi:hypothetical protein
LLSSSIPALLPALLPVVLPVSLLVYIIREQGISTNTLIITTKKELQGDMTATKKELREQGISTNTLIMTTKK